MIVVVMGVAGAGKSTVGALLAEALALPFVEGDDYHPRENVAKMRRGEALDDADRSPWLDALCAEIAGRRDGGAVVACSALKRAYRGRLRDAGATAFVYLRIAPADAATRLAGRDGHFMPAALIDSQVAALEEPRRAIQVDAARPADELVGTIRSALC